MAKVLDCQWAIAIYHCCSAIRNLSSQFLCNLLASKAFESISPLVVLNFHCKYCSIELNQILSPRNKLNMRKSALSKEKEDER